MPSTSTATSPLTPGTLRTPPTTSWRLHDAGHWHRGDANGRQGDLNRYGPDLHDGEVAHGPGHDAPRGGPGKVHGEEGRQEARRPRRRGRHGIQPSRFLRLLNAGPFLLTHSRNDPAPESTVLAFQALLTRDLLSASVCF